MPNWKRIEQLLGETIREIGILVVVFAPLDAFFSEKHTGPYFLAGVMSWALAVIGYGIFLETGE